MIEYFDQDGRPLDLISWAKMLGDDEYRVLATDEVGKYTIKTVWNGFDGSQPENEPHEIFTTGVFLTEDSKNPDGFELIEEHAYVSKPKALKGHADLVMSYRSIHEQN